MPVKCKDIVLTKNEIDHRIGVIENLVADAYTTTVHELDVFYKDTPAKLMCCFLLHDLLQYSVRSIAVKYCVYPQFLDNKIQEHYIKCLQDSVFMARVQGLKNAFLKAFPEACKKENKIEINVYTATPLGGI